MTISEEQISRKFLFEIFFGNIDIFMERLFKVHNEEIDGMQVDVANCSLATVTNELSIEQPPPSIDTQHILASDNV